MHTPFSPTVGLLTLGLFLAASTAAQEQVSVGTKPSYEFKSSPYNSRGVKSLADLRGAPTIIEFWGTR